MGHRLLWGGALVALTALVGGGAARLQFDNSYRIWFLDNDPALLAYDRLVERFGSDEAIVVGLNTEGDPFSSKTLSVVKRLSDSLSRLPGVLEVWSLTHMDAMVDAGGALELRPLVDRVPPDPETVKQARALVERSPLYRSLVSADHNTTTILLTLERTEASFDAKAQLVKQVRKLVGEQARGREVWLAGGAVLDEAMYRYSEEDTLLYAPVMALVVVVILAWLFRSAVAVVLPLGVVALSVGWALGLMGWAGWDANIITTVLPPVLAAVGIADSIHMLQQLRLFRRRGVEPAEAARQAFIHVLRPCLLTSLTTAAGMASLLAASLPAIRELGVAAAVGVLAAFALTVVGIPICLATMPSSWLGGLAGKDREAAPRWLGRATDLAVRRRWGVAVGAGVLAVAAGVGIGRLSVGTNMASYFFEDDPVYQESLAADRTLGGSLPLQVLMQVRGKGDLIEPAALARIEAIGAYLERLPATGPALSGLDFIKEARRVLLSEPPGTLGLPASRAEAAQILLLLEGEDDLRRFLSEDRRSARVEVYVEATDYEALVAHLPEIEARLSQLAGGQIQAKVTGLARLMADMESYLFSSQVRSFGLAFVLVMGCITLLFRSLRAGLLSAVPNLWPLLLTLGAMGWLGIRLDATTVLIAPVLLGIVVDDTVHLLERVLVTRQGGSDVPQAFRTAVGEVGHAVLMTTVVLACGFLTPLLGSFKPNCYFAALAALALVLALLADLLVFPAVALLLPRLVPGDRRRP